MNVNQDFARARTRLFCLPDGQRLYPVERVTKHPAHLRLREWMEPIGREFERSYPGREFTPAR
jgi:hypothetical protein